MLQTILGRVGLPVLVGVLSEALGRIDNPATKGASDALKRVSEAVGSGQIGAEQLAEANRHVEALESIKSDELRTALAEVNQSLRTEVASQDAYVRRMRPTFGYLMALTWAAQMFDCLWDCL